MVDLPINEELIFKNTPVEGQQRDNLSTPEGRKFESKADPDSDSDKEDAQQYGL
jgi:hypothetical protein